MNRFNILVVFFLTLFLLTLVVPSVRAQDTPALDKREQKRARNLAANMTNRMEATVFRLEKIIERLESRLQKQQDAGLDRGAAFGFLGQAKATLNNAKVELTLIDARVEKSVTSNNPKGHFDDVRQAYARIKGNISEAHLHTNEALLVAKNQTPANTTTKTANNEATRIATSSATSSDAGTI